jgi:hypothetical protein
MICAATSDGGAVEKSQRDRTDGEDENGEDGKDRKLLAGHSWWLAAISHVSLFNHIF